jgi:hypothetical protein
MKTSGAGSRAIDAIASHYNGGASFRSRSAPLEQVEDLPVEQLVSEPDIGALHVAILPEAINAVFPKRSSKPASCI